MNGRILQGPLAAVVAAVAVAAFSVTSTAAAQPAGGAPAGGAGAASGSAAAPTGAAETAKPEAKAETADVAKPDPAKKVAQTTDTPPSASEPPANSTKDSALDIGPSNDISLSVGAQPRKDEAKTQAKNADDAEANRNPFTGSIFFWDQSLSTQTAHLDTSAQQTYLPTYEWWFSFQPRYYFSKKLSYRLRLDYTKELTNSGDTTDYREGLWGDVWNSLRYETPISERLKHTKVSVTGTIKLPLSKESQARTIYFKPGIGVGIAQKIPINGESAKWFQSAGVALSGSYEHPLQRSTTATGNFTTTRQDTDGRSFNTDQITGGMLANHTVLAALRGDLQITEKWSTSLSMIAINQWNYNPTSNATLTGDVVSTGGTTVNTDNKNATNFTQSTWFIFGTDYDLLDELSVGVGYYNLAGVIAPDGQTRGLTGDHNVWWSPQARVFGTITANLDKIYERAAGIKPKKEEAKSASAKANQL